MTLRRDERVLHTGVDDSIQACLSDALNALDGFSLAPEKPHAGERQSCATASTKHHDAPVGNNAVLDGSKSELQQRILQAAAIVRKLCAQKARLESRVRELEQLVISVNAEASEGRLKTRCPYPASFHNVPGKFTSLMCTFLIEEAVQHCCASHRQVRYLLAAHRAMMDTTNRQ